MDLGLLVHDAGHFVEQDGVLLLDLLLSLLLEPEALAVIQMLG